ncbi:hypothetical protein [Sphingorhabdus sp. Alg231-15]|uniref:hypothetical protein n=1 Tax=Sphingorhabdus sp. Alg231-15 TaxID=1922222 RepID=UPI000D55ED0E
MRPNSIIQFERFYLGALAIGLVGNVVNWSKAVELVQTDPAIGAMGTGVLIGSIVFGLAISLLLWFFAARRGAAVAKWFIVFFFVIGLASVPFSLGQLSGPAIVTSLLSILLQGAAVYMLFRPDAKKWFAGEKVVDLEKTFE